MSETAETVTEIICAQCTGEVPAADECTRCGEPTALAGRYRLLEVVGRGSFGMTYRAKRFANDEILAIKEMLVRRADTVKSVELFEREAMVLEQLDHPGIPTYYDELWHEDGRSTAFFLIQEFIEGEVVQNTHFGRPNRPREVFEMLAELLETLAYLHEFAPPVVHRDIKPENLMIRDEDGSLVLIDFGSVQAAINPKEGGSTVAGTFGYMAPEQYSGHAEPRTDVYGAAATAVALLSGVEPSSAPGQTPQLTGLNIEAPYRRLLTRMFRPDAEDRPTAVEAADALRSLMEPGPQPDSSSRWAETLSPEPQPEQQPEPEQPPPPDADDDQEPEESVDHVVYTARPTRNYDGSIPSNPTDAPDQPRGEASPFAFTGVLAGLTGLFAAAAFVMILLSGRTPLTLGVMVTAGLFAGATVISVFVVRGSGN